MLYEVITILLAAGRPLTLDQLLAMFDDVITSYSIHYTKLYEPFKPSAPHGSFWNSALISAHLAVIRLYKTAS